MEVKSRFPEQPLSLTKQNLSTDAPKIAGTTKIAKVTQIPSKLPKSSIAFGEIVETKTSFSSAPIKYVLSYRDKYGSRFKDEVVRNIESLESLSQTQHTQIEGTLEVTRIVMLQNM